MKGDFKSLHLVSEDLLPIVEQMAARDRSKSLEVRRRERLEALEASLQPNPAVERTERFIVGPEGNIRLLVYKPKSTSGPSAGLLHIHGGGFVMGAPEYEDERNNRIAAELGLVVVSVAYRLAPEASYPSALDDCYAALLWLRDQAAELNVDSSRLGVVGESAGGGHAAALCLLARDRGEVSLAFQWLVYPMLDDRTGSTVTPHDYAGEFVWTGNDNREGWRAMLGHAPGAPPLDRYAVPGRADDLSGLPSTLLQTGALDLFCEEDLEYARRLIRSGVPTEVHVYPGAIHGYPLAKDSIAARATLRDGFDALRRALA